MLDKCEFLCFLIQVLHMARTIEVSHWGNVAVEETFHMKHVGAELQVSDYCLRDLWAYVG